MEVSFTIFVETENGVPVQNMYFCIDGEKMSKLTKEQEKHIIENFNKNPNPTVTVSVEKK